MYFLEKVRLRISHSSSNRNSHSRNPTQYCCRGRRVHLSLEIWNKDADRITLRQTYWGRSREKAAYCIPWWNSRTANS